MLAWGDAWDVSAVLWSCVRWTDGGAARSQSGYRLVGSDAGRGSHPTKGHCYSEHDLRGVYNRLSETLCILLCTIDEFKQPRPSWGPCPACTDAEMSER